MSFFYKFFLSLQSNLSPNLVSALDPWLPRELSSGTQSYQPHPDEYPVGKYIPKIEAWEQAAGETKYADDYPTPADCLFACFIRATQCACRLVSIDVSAVVSSPGVVSVLTAKDLPLTQNQYFDDLPTSRLLFLPEGETIDYVGQTIGLVIAKDRLSAEAAATLVKITTDSAETPILTVDDAIKAGSIFSTTIPTVKVGDADTAIKNSKNVISGTIYAPRQFHWHMEPHTAIASPGEGDKIEVRSATQLPVSALPSVAKALGLPLSKVEIKAGRLGGGFGGKLTNSILPAVAAAVAVQKVKVPVRIILPVSHNTESLGRRPCTRFDYQVGFDENHKLQGVKVVAYLEGGAHCKGVLNASKLVTYMISNCYYCPNWTIDAKMCKTNTPECTSTRGPGWFPAVYAMEKIMQHAAKAALADELLFRQNNFYQVGSVTPSGEKLTGWNIPQVLSEVLNSSQYTARQTEVANFNNNNKWRKRGLSVVPVRFGIGYNQAFSSLVNIYPDGSVVITKGGIEMGQGLDTKVIQVCAKTLGIDMSLITIHVTTTGVNNGPTEITGGSVGTELTCVATVDACNQLNAILSQARSQLPPGAPWTTLVSKALSMNLPLGARGFSGSHPKPSGNFNYESYSAALTEVEVDILTGEIQVVRLDVMFDCGYSLNPALDMGQIEGAVVMGIGAFTTEDVQYGDDGTLITNNFWTYKPPSAFDIPVTLNVTLFNGAPNPVGLFSSKACSEPPMLCTASVVLAIENAVAASLLERGKISPGQYACIIRAPASVAAVQELANIQPSDFNLK